MTRTGLRTGLCAWLGACLVAIAPAHADQHERRATVTVVGEGEVSLKPDRASVTVGVVAREKTAEEAQDRVNRAMAETIDEIEDGRFDGLEIQTSGVSLSPVYEQWNSRQQDREPRIIAYTASSRVSVRVDDVDRLGEVLDAALAGGSNQMFGVTFELRDDSAARAEALGKAVENGRSKAEAIAGGLDGVFLGGLVEIVEMGSQRPPIAPMARGGAVMTMQAEAAPTVIEAGTVTVSASVTMTFTMVIDR